MFESRVCHLCTEPPPSGCSVSFCPHEMKVVITSFRDWLKELKV